MPKDEDVAELATCELGRGPSIGFGNVVIRLLQNRNFDWSSIMRVMALVAGQYLSMSDYARIRAGRREVRPAENVNFSIVLGVDVGAMAALSEVDDGMVGEAGKLQREISWLIWDMRSLDVRQIDSMIRFSSQLSRLCDGCHGPYSRGPDSVIPGIGMPGTAVFAACSTSQMLLQGLTWLITRRAAATGLVHMGARWYDSVTGALTSSDTEGGTPLPITMDCTCCPLPSCRSSTTRYAPHTVLQPLGRVRSTEPRTASDAASVRGQRLPHDGQPKAVYSARLAPACSTQRGPRLTVELPRVDATREALPRFLPCRGSVCPVPLQMRHGQRPELECLKYVRQTRALVVPLMTRHLRDARRSRCWHNSRSGPYPSHQSEARAPDASRR